jgi:hypothetical protein
MLKLICLCETLLLKFLKKTSTESLTLTETPDPVKLNASKMEAAEVSALFNLKTLLMLRRFSMNRINLNLPHMENNSKCSLIKLKKKDTKPVAHPLNSLTYSYQTCPLEQMKPS